MPHEGTNIRRNRVSRTPTWRLKSVWDTIQTLRHDEARIDPDSTAALPQFAAAHRAQRRLHDREVDALIDAYRVGATILELAGRFAIHRTTVIAHLNRRGVQRRLVAKQWDDDALSEAARSYANGASLADIAKQNDLDPQTVANRLRRSGVIIRPRPGWKRASPNILP